MNTISVNYALVWELSIAPEYKFTKCGKCFNTKRGIELKKCYNGGSIGLNIRGRFHSLTYLRPKLSRITPSYCPF